MDQLRQFADVALSEVEIRRLHPGPDGAGRLLQAVDQGSELERREQTPDLVGVVVAPDAIGGIDV